MHDLIDRNSFLFADYSQFHGILVQYIYSLLQEKEKACESEKNWIEQESLSNKSLLLGGTLSNVLSRRVYSVIVQMFAQIIMTIDRNCNLNLIIPNKEGDCISQLWLSFFKNPQVMQLKYTDLVKKEEYLPGVGARLSSHDIKASFPFSWLVYDSFACLLVSTIASKSGLFLWFMLEQYYCVYLLFLLQNWTESKFVKSCQNW